MAASVRSDVLQALASGRTYLADPVTGFHRSLYADCPNDGQPSPVRRVEYGAGHSIARVTMRCPNCQQEFTPATESLYLR